MKTKLHLAILAGVGISFFCAAAEPGLTINVWPGKAPGETTELPPEKDSTKPEDKLIAGRRIIKLANVSTPTLAVFRPAKAKDTGAAVIVCPGGGFNILAYDLEGTEVAEWLSSIGVTGIVLKYRVPFRNQDKRWQAAVQDAQRSVSLVRSKAGEWGLDPKRIGILGFSAGGATAALTACLYDERQYAAVDAVDEISCRPDFAAPIYPGGLVAKDGAFTEFAKCTAGTPPMFIAQAGDDRVDPANSVLLWQALKEAKVSAELHIYATGGHGYGLRQTDQPCTTWPARFGDWLQSQGWLKAGK